MKKICLLASLIAAAVIGSTPLPVRAQKTAPKVTKPIASKVVAPKVVASHRELPAVRKMLDASLLQLQSADSLAAYAQSYDTFSKVIALDSKSRQAFAARGEVVRRALRLQSSLLAEDETPRKELLDADASLRDFDQAAALSTPASGGLSSLIFYGRGFLLLNAKNDARNAVAAFDQSIAANANFGPAYLERALAAVRLPQADLKKVFADYDQALQLGFQFSKLGLEEDATFKDFFQNQLLSTALHGRGLLLALRNENEKSLVDLNAAIAANPLNIAAIGDRARLFAAMKQPQNAVIDYSAIIAFRSGDIEAFRARAAQYDALGDKQKAAADRAQIEAIRAAANGKLITPAAPVARVETSLDVQKSGDAFSSQGKMDEAIAEYSRAIQLDAKNLDALSSRGWAYARTRKYSAAVQDFDAALKLRPDDIELLIARGQIGGRAGQTDNAIADLKRAGELAPNNIAAWEQLGVVYQANGKYSEAETNFAKAVEVFITDPKASGQQSTLASLRLAIVRAAQSKDQNLNEVVGSAGKDQLAGAISIAEFEIKKQPANTFLTALRDAFVREWRVF